MIIDIIIVILLLLAVVLGIRQGLLTQICYLVAIVCAINIAPGVSTPIGLHFTDNEATAHAIGFGIILIGAAILVWLIAPLLKKLLFWNLLRSINALLGAVIALITTTLLLSMLCTTLNTANLGEINRERIGELIYECDGEEELESKLSMVLDKNATMRDYYKPKYIDFATLDASFLFYKLVELGDYIYPHLDSLQSDMEEIKQYATESIVERVSDNDITE